MIYTNKERDVIEISPGVFVPVDADNADFQAIAETGVQVKNAPGDKAPADAPEKLASLVAKVEAKEE